VIQTNEDAVLPARTRIFAYRESGEHKVLVACLIGHPYSVVTGVVNLCAFPRISIQFSYLFVKPHEILGQRGIVRRQPDLALPTPSHGPP
jgi:hypothetical protein